MHVCSDVAGKTVNQRISEQDIPYKFPSKALLRRTMRRLAGAKNEGEVNSLVTGSNPSPKYCLPSLPRLQGAMEVKACHQAPSRGRWWWTCVQGKSDLHISKSSSKGSTCCLVG